MQATAGILLLLGHDSKLKRSRTTCFLAVYGVFHVSANTRKHLEDRWTERALFDNKAQQAPYVPIFAGISSVSTRT